MLRSVGAKLLCVKSLGSGGLGCAVRCYAHSEVVHLSTQCPPLKCCYLIESYLLFVENLPKMSLAAHAMTSARLLRSGLTYSRMQAFFESCTSFMDFFDKLKDMGITRSSAKSIALKLDGMGLRCRGIDESIESNYKCFDQVEDDGNDTTPLQRSDSGYSSGTPSSPPVELPESLFFPTNDKILFGEFTEEELEFNDELEALETTCKTLSVNDTAFDTKTSTSLEQWGDIFCESEMHSQGTQCTAADESNGKPDIYFGDFDSCVEEDSSGVDFNDFHSDKDNVITELCSPAVSDVPAAEAGNSEKTGLAVCEDGGIDQMEEELWEVDDSAAGFQISFKKSIPLSLTLDDFSNRKGIKNFRTCGVTPVMVEETRLSTYSNRKRREKKKKLAKQTVEQRIKAWDKIVPTKVKVDENILNLRRCVLDAASKAIA